MTEDKRNNPGSEVLHDKTQERNKAIHGFARNFGLFLEEKEHRIVLAEFPFIRDLQKLLVMNFKDDIPVPFEYNNMDLELIAIFDRYRKSDTQTMVLNNSFILEDYDDMPERLKGFVGKNVSTVSEIYELVSMPDESARISRTRYFVTGEDDKPVYEFWMAERTSENQPLPDSGTKKSSALKIPTPEYSLTR